MSKHTLPAAPWQQRNGLAALLGALGSGDGATRFVGGSVRDTLLGLPVSDLDLATRFLPEEVVKRLRQAGLRAVPTGLAHGTITAVLADGPVEVTTLRRDLTTDGRHATVAFSDDWREDAARRDFTINALSADPLSGEVFDYFGGLVDLEAGTVRFIGEPLQRIAEDHLRILRFFRFHARFGRGQPDEAALSACTARANDLMALSRERIADELLKLLGVADPIPAITLIVQRNILRPVLPEIGADGVEHLKALIRREAAMAVPPSPLRRLASLLPAAPDEAASIGARLKLSKAAQRRLALAVTTSREPPRARSYLAGEEAAIDQMLLSNNDDETIAASLHAVRAWERPRLPIGGDELVGMGLLVGPVVAGTLQAIERRWIDENFPSKSRVREIAEEEVAQALRERQ